MALFSDLASAEARAREGVRTGLWVNAHSARDVNGKIVVRVQRFMNISDGFGATDPTFDGMNKAGGWDELDDDTET